MHLHDVMGWRPPMTHRQFVAWQDWLGRQWNEPTRSDHYLMQIAAEVRRVNLAKAEDQKSITLEMYEIPFEFKVKTEKVKEKEKFQPFGVWTKERIAKAQADIAKANMLKIVNAAGVKRGA